MGAPFATTGGFQMQAKKGWRQPTRGIVSFPLGPVLQPPPPSGRRGTLER